MSQSVKLRLEDLDIKPYLLTKLKMAGIESVFELAISIPHQLTDISGGMLTGTDEHVALELVTQAKKALVDSGLLYKDFSTAQDILDRRKNLLRCTTDTANGLNTLNSLSTVIPFVSVVLPSRVNWLYLENINGHEL